MKKLLSFLVCIFAFIGGVHAETMNLNWIVDGETYAQTTCEYGNDLILPTAPTKYGYTFRGWAQYIPLEYIQSSGTQYIDTGLYCTSNNVEFKIKVYVNNSITNEQDLISNYGTGTSVSTIGRFVVGFYSAGVFAYARNSSQSESNAVVEMQAGAQTLDIDAVYDFENSTKSIIVNGYVGTSTYTKNITNSGYTINLFRQASGNATSYFKGKVYYVQYFENGTIKLDLIPAKRASDNAIGMYDTVTGTFFTNSGTGNFIAGPEI